MPNNTWYDASGALGWNDAGGWSLTRVPTDGDSIFITGPNSPNNSHPVSSITLQSLDTTGLTDPNGFDANNIVGSSLTLATGGYLLLTGQDAWYGNAALAGTSTFSGSSRNLNLVGDRATFNESSSNYGTVGNFATFKDNAINTGGCTAGDNAIFAGNAENDGVVGDNARFTETSLAFSGSYGTNPGSITRFEDASIFYQGQINAGTVTWNSTGTIAGGLWTFPAAKSGNTHSVGGGVLAGL